MKAVVLTGIGGVEKLTYVLVDTPIPQKDEVLVKVLYCGINHLDLLIRQGKRVGPKTFPHILGSEIVGQLPSGEVIAVYPWTFCGVCNECKNGEEQMCDMSGTIGRTQWGGYAEYVVIPKKNLVKIPKDKTQEAASIVLAGTTACHLIEKGNIPDRARVLVTGATGGVGTLVVELLKRKKCEIICATSHKSKIALLQKSGVEYIVSTQTMVEEVQTLFPQGVSFAIDLVGGETWSKAIQTLGKNGKIVFCSTSKEEEGSIDIRNTFAKELHIMGSNGGSMKNFREMLFLLEKGILHSIIDSEFLLKDVAKTHRKMEKQQVFGKMLLRLT